MTLPIRAQVSARRFSPEHRIGAARARHSRTELERRTFEYSLDQAWNSRAPSCRDIRRFVSVTRRRIQRGEFARQYSVTPNTLCDWLRRWRKAQHEPMRQSGVSPSDKRKVA